MPRLFGDTILRALDANGVPVSGARLRTYDEGTTTPVTTYSDAALSVAHAFPVLADSSGVFPPVFVAAGDYKISVTTPADVELPGSPVDNVQVLDEVPSPLPQSAGGTGAASLGDALVTPTNGVFDSLADHLQALAKFQPGDAAPTKNQLGGTTVAQTVPRLVGVAGTEASPETSATYRTPMIYLERFSGSANANSCDYSNAKLSPLIVVEQVATAGATASLTGASFRTYTEATRPTGAEPIVGVVALAQSNSGAGNQNYDVFAANFIVSTPSGEQATDAVCIEADVIPSADAPVVRPGQPGARNYTAYWAQAAQSGTGYYSNTAFYASQQGGNSGWRYGIVIDANVSEYGIFIDNQSTAAGANAAYFEIGRSASDAFCIQCVAGGSEQFRVDGAVGGTANPVWISIAGVLQNVSAGAADSAGTGFRTLRVPNAA